MFLDDKVKQNLPIISGEPLQISRKMIQKRHFEEKGTKKSAGKKPRRFVKIFFEAENYASAGASAASSAGAAASAAASASAAALAAAISAFFLATASALASFFLASSSRRFF